MFSDHKLIGHGCIRSNGRNDPKPHPAWGALPATMQEDDGMRIAWIARCGVGTARKLGAAIGHAAILAGAAILAPPGPADTAIGASTSGHYVTYRDRPILLVGDSGTQCVLQNDNLDFARWVDDCAAAGLNTLHVWSFVAPRQQLDGSDVENRYGYLYPGITPWARRDSGPRAHDGGFQWDLHQWDEGETPDHYWPRLRALCARAQEKELLLGITVFWGWPKHPADWAYHPFNMVNGGPVADTPKPHVTQVQIIATPGTEVWEEDWSAAWPPAKQNQWHWERFAAKLVAETASFDNVFFVFMDEHSYSEGNGGDHFREFFQRRGLRWVDHDKRRETVDFVFEPVTHTNDSIGRNPEVVQRFYCEPARPFLILEGEPYQGDAVRHSLWSALMGGAGFVFHNDERQETIHTGIMGYDPKVPGGDTGALRRAWLGHASRFFNEHHLPIDRMRPLNGKVREGSFCLAQPGAVYAVYATPSDAPITVDLADVSGDYGWRLYDPRNGTWPAEGTCTGGAVLSLNRPTSEDWALLITRSG